MQKQLEILTKVGNYIIVKLRKGIHEPSDERFKEVVNTWVIGYIEFGGNDKICITRSPQRHYYFAEFAIFRSSPDIKPLSDIMLTSENEQLGVMYDLIKKCALEKYGKEDWCGKYKKKSITYIEKTIKFKFVEQCDIRIDEDIVYRDIGNIIEEYVPHYTLTNIVDSNTSIDGGSKIKYDDVIIDEFIFNQSYAPFYRIVDQMHDNYVKYNKPV